MSTIRLELQVVDILVRQIEATAVEELRDRDMVALTAYVDTHEVRLELLTSLTRRLHHQLGKLFPGDDVVGLFKEVTGLPLTTDSIRELGERLETLRGHARAMTEQVTFPPEVDPGDAVEEVVKETPY